MNDLHVEFTKHARNGHIGAPEGELAYAYLRASSTHQVEEGSSFSRQLENIHKAAERDGLRIPFDLIYFDDGYSGFEFEHRPDLLKVLHEIKTQPRAYHIVIEDIDRLSRNADWQQGFLLEEFFRRDIEIHFYIDPGSSLERYIRGFMAQEEMKKAKERMRMGVLHKAMSGKVTSKRPRYGYILTKDSYYELHPEQSKVVRQIYEFLLYKRWTLHQVAKWLNDRGVPTTFKAGVWSASSILQMIKSPVYKGDFYANRHYWKKTGEYKEDGRPKTKRFERPQSEWIHVQVPAIVTPEEWEEVQKVLKSNAKRSSRNYKKRNWLLVGFMICDECKEYSYRATMGGSPNSPQRYYFCSSNDSEKARLLKLQCKSPFVRAEVLEQRVWEEIENLIFDPTVILDRFDETHLEERVRRYEEQLLFIDNRLEGLARNRRKLIAAYERDIYDLDEFEEKMLDVNEQMETLRNSHEEVEEKLEETHSVEEQRQVVISALSKLQEKINLARENGEQSKEIPFEMKRKIMSLLIDTIRVNSKEGIFIIEGEIQGVFTIDKNFSLDSSQKLPQCGLFL